MNKTQLNAFCVLLMCSDPWPVDETVNGGRDAGNMATVKEFVDEQAKALGYADWIDAFHQLAPLEKIQGQKT